MIKPALSSVGSESSSSRGITSAIALFRQRGMPTCSIVAMGRKSVGSLEACGRLVLLRGWGFLPKRARRPSDASALALKKNCVLYRPRLLFVECAWPCMSYRIAAEILPYRLGGTGKGKRSPSNSVHQTSAPRLFRTTFVPFQGNCSTRNKYVNGGLSAAE